MYKNIFDTHSHYNDESFSEDMDSVLAALPAAGICRIINCGTNVKSSAESLEMAHRYGWIFAAAGVHPSDCMLVDESTYLDEIRALCSDEKCVAVGEIGLDYHYDDTPQDIQLRFFEQQLVLANELKLPVIVHDREAHADTLTLLSKHRPAGVLHCFSGSVETMREVVTMGMYIGLGGAVTFKNAKKPLEVACEVPLDRLLLETDCPYMTPVPHRGKRNDSSYIPFTAQKIAEVRGMDTQELIDITTGNAKRLFGIGE